ncbi:MMPL family transporter [Corynebacterium amycolatum]
MPSATASHVIEEKFPDVPNPIREQRIYVAFEAPEGQRLDDPQNKEAVDQVINGIRDNVGQISDDLQLHNPVDLNPKMQAMVKEQGMAAGLPKDVAEADANALRTVSDDGRYGISTFVFDAKMPQDIEPENMQALLDAMQAGRDAGIKVEASGPGMQPAIEVAPTSEIIGVTVAFIVLVVTFGSLVASFLPIVTAVVGIIIGVFGVTLMTAFTDVNSITPVLAVMFGLAVGIDYALFILSRYRAERARGMTNEDAIGMATGTAGSAVVFAGLTVIVALAALTVAKVPFMSLMGISAAITVAFTVLVSLTLLPAVMSLLGDKVFAGRVPGFIRSGKTPMRFMVLPGSPQNLPSATGSP